MISRTISIFLAGIIVVLAYFVIDYSIHIFFSGYGSFRKITKHIDIYPIAFDDQNITKLHQNYMFVSTHELGHYIFFEKLTKDQRIKCKELYKKSNYITNYSKENHKEWFADYYAIYNIAPDVFDTYASEEEKNFFYTIKTFKH